MENILEWFTNNGEQLGLIIGGVFGIATAIVALVNGPRSGVAQTWLDRILGVLRLIGLATFKDEPGTGSLPGFKDTGKRVVATEDA
jgi:hypothetical protein